MWHTGLFAPDQGSNPHLLRCEADFQWQDHQEAPVSLFPQLPLPSTGGLTNIVATAVRMEVKRGLSNTDFHSPRLTWLQPPLRTQSVSPETRRAPGRALHPRVISQLPGGRLIAVNLLCDKRAAFCSHWVRQVFWIQICLLCKQMSLPKQPSMAALAVQRLGIHPPMQETRVWSLGWEDPTRLRATKLSVTATEPGSPRALEQSSAPRPEKPPQCAPHRRVAPAHCNGRKPECSHKDPARPKVEKTLSFLIIITKFRQGTPQQEKPPH